MSSVVPASWRALTDGGSRAIRRNATQPPTEATTVAVQLPRQEAAASRGRQSATRNSLTGPIIFGVAALIGLIVVAAGLNWLGSSGQATVPSPSTPLVLISPSTSLSPSPSPSPSPSQSPSPTQATTPPPDRFAAARDRLTETYQAIEAAKGGGGLKGKEANQLRGPADKVGRAIDANDARGARAAADDLIDAVRKDIDEKRVGGEDAQRLLSAAQALRDSIPAG